MKIIVSNIVVQGNGLKSIAFDAVTDGKPEMHYQTEVGDPSLVLRTAIHAMKRTFPQAYFDDVDPILRKKLGLPKERPRRFDSFGQNGLQWR